MQPALPWKVGELARRTGLTIRTLHHYDEIGLLQPSMKSDSGHRLYTQDDVARLQQILSLRHLGFSLDEIHACLDQPGFSPRDIIAMHVTRLREQVRLQQNLCARLEALNHHFQARETVSTEELLQTIEVMNMIEKYYTPEQLETLRQRREQALASGVDIVQEGANAWTQLFAELKVEMEKGTDPADPRVQVLEKRRKELIRAFTGGDKGIEQSLTQMWTQQGEQLSAQYGYDPKLMEYMAKVTAAAPKE